MGCGVALKNSGPVAPIVKTMVRPRATTPQPCSSAGFPFGGDELIGEGVRLSTIVRW